MNGSSHFKDIIKLFDDIEKSLMHKEKIISVGTSLSNIVYNLAQDKRLTQAERVTLDKCRRDWDEALRGLK